jgi:hypothetical protein
MKSTVKAIALFALLATSCAQTSRIITRSVIQDFSSNSETRNKAIFDSAITVLTRNGFDVTVANERLGLINTSYRDIESKADSSANVIGAILYAMSSGPRTYNSYSRSLMISIQIKESGYVVIPKISQHIRSTNVFSSNTAEKASFPEQKSDEGRMVDRLISEINESAGIESDFRWEEKEIEIKSD